MILADTSVWVDHLRHGDPRFAQLLRDELILMHPFVLGELACGNLHQRNRMLADPNTLARSKSASDAEVHELIETRHLFGRGIGWVDAHLLASAFLSRCSFWTLDERLARIARDLNIPAVH